MRLLHVDREAFIQWIQRLGWRRLLVLCAIAALLGAFLSCGFDLAHDGNVAFASPLLWMLWLTCSVVLFLLMALALFCRDRRRRIPRVWTPNERRRILVLSALAISVVWMMVLLAGWPGFYVYDTSAFLDYINEGTLTTFQPAFHTLFVSAFLKLGLALFGSFNWGVALYTVVQQIICLFVLLLMLDTLLCCGISKMGITISVMFIALNPYIAMLTACTTKDILFSYYLVGFITAMVRIHHGFGNMARNAVLLGIFSSLLLVYRNNALPAMAVFFIFLIILFRCKRAMLVKLALPFALSFCAYALFTGPVSSMLGVEKSNALQEMISIPTMEIAHVSETSEEMYDLLDASGVDAAEVVSSYQTSVGNSDGVRILFWDLLNDRGFFEILRLWAQARAIDFWGCVEADMLLTNASWNPFGVIDGYEGYYQTVTPSYGFSPIAESPAVQDSKIPALYDVIYYLSRYNAPEYTGVLFPVVSVFPYVWMLLLACAASLLDRDQLNRAISVLPLLLVMTNWLGPLVLLRYYLYLPLLAPLLVSCCLLRRGVGDIEKGERGACYA